MGKSHPIWGNFDIVVDKHDPDVKCKKCNTMVLSARPSRNMMKHAVEHCIPEERQKWKKYDDAANEKKIWKLGRGKYTPRKPPSRTRSPAPTPSASTSPTRRLRFDSSPPAIGPPGKRVRLDKLSKEEHDRIIAEGFYATGISFRCVENPLFQRMFAQKLPSRKDFATGLLDATYERHRKRVIELLRGKTHLGLVSDGWSNVNNDSVVNFVVTRPDMKPVFWTSIVTEDNSHTGQYIANLLASAIQDIEAEVGEGAITAVVTDNAANMKAAWRILRRKRRDLICHGCAAHGLDLLVKDMFKIQELKAVLSKSKMVALFIKQHHGLWYRFRKILDQTRGPDHPHAKRPSLPVSTRWYSTQDSISRVVNNRDVFMMALSDPNLLEKYRQKRKKQHNASPRRSQRSPVTSSQSQSVQFSVLASSQTSERWSGLQLSLPLTQPSQNSTQSGRWSPPTRPSVASGTAQQYQQCSQQSADSSQSTHWPDSAQSLMQSEDSQWSPPPVQLAQSSQVSLESPQSLRCPSPTLSSQEVYDPTSSVSQSQSESQWEPNWHLFPRTQQLPSLFQPREQNEGGEHPHGQGEQNLSQPGSSSWQSETPENDLNSQQSSTHDNVDEVMSIIRDDHFWKSGEVVINAIQPVNEGIANFESDNCCISVIYPLFKKLLSSAIYTESTPTIAASLQTKLLDTVARRRKKIVTPLARVAYLLDWYKPLQFSRIADEDPNSIIIEAAKLAKEHELLGGVTDQQFVDTLTRFVDRKREAARTRSPRAPTVDPLHWWENKGSNDPYDCLKDFAARIFAIPTSSAASERSWSIHKFIHSNGRNRLTPERVTKLVFVYSNMVERGEANAILYELFPEADCSTGTYARGLDLCRK